MTAIAPNAPTHEEEDHRPCPAPVIWSATNDPERPQSLSGRPARAPSTVASPWRDPLFYLSFVAMAFLLCAVGLILLYRTVTGRRTR